jgi:hypothetical protein
MTDRELWVKSMKTVGAMVGGSMVFLGSVSLILLLGGGGHAAASASETQSGPGGPVMSREVRGSDAIPPAKTPRHGGMKGGEPHPSESRSGESI